MAFFVFAVLAAMFLGALVTMSAIDHLEAKAPTGWSQSK